MFKSRTISPITMLLGVVNDCLHPIGAGADGPSYARGFSCYSCLPVVFCLVEFKTMKLMLSELLI